jgi:uncharacterized membrane protein
MRGLQLGFLEHCVLLAIAALLMQAFPSIFLRAWNALDIRDWTYAHWFMLQGVILVALLWNRFGKEFFQECTAHDPQKEKRLERKKKIQEIQTRKETLMRFKEARRKRIW